MRERDRAEQFSVRELIELLAWETALRFHHLEHLIINQEAQTMATIDELSASLDAQKASLDNLTTLEAAEAAGGLQPGQVAVDQATLDAAAQKVADNQAEIDALIAADSTVQPPPAG